MRFTRRSALAGLAGAPVFCAPEPAYPQPRGGTLPETAPFGPELRFTRGGVPPKSRPFAMNDVRLLAGPFQEAAEWNRGYLHRLPADRLVHNFRLNAGLPSRAEALGGWEKYGSGADSELRGHFTGHYLSGCALLWASTGDSEIKAKADSMVDDLAACQKKLGAGGYLSAFPPEWFDRLDARKRVWAPFYTIHKIMAGMFDMYRLAGNRQAFAVLEGMADWADQWTAGKSEEHMQDILNTEYGGMNDILYELAGATGEDRWAKVGDRFTKKKFFNPLALRRDELLGLHVNTHIPQVIGAARRYEISGDMRFHDVADYFWWEVTGARCYATGGTSNNEGWLAPPRQLAAELRQSTETAECCCAYNMMKLSRKLHGWKGDPRYFDYYERALLNHRLGTIRPETGATQYFLSLTPGAWKTFSSEDRSFWCCTGTGVEEYAKLNDSIYWQDPAGLSVNLYIASELQWREKGLSVRMETRFPESEEVRLTFDAANPVTMRLRLRIPAWVESTASIRLNGKPLEAVGEPGGYLSLRRTWQKGDQVDLRLPMSLRLEAMPDDAKMAAILYGPLVLAGDLGNQGLREEMIAGPTGQQGPRLQDAAPLDIPALRASGRGVSAWVKADQGPSQFRTVGQAKDVSLVPLNRIFDRRYTVYWRLS